jgi:cysteine desulfurase
MKFPIYLDHQATTPVDPRVLEAMLPFFSEDFGNPASRSHSLGWKAEEKVEEARAQIAQLIAADQKEIIFTSGATESDNLALKGSALTYREKGNHIITCVTEHKAVLDSCKSLEQNGFKVTYLPVNSSGILDINQLKAAITDETILISVMMANNEIGVLQPIAELGKIAKEKKIIFHTDAAQAVGIIPINVEAMGIDLLSFSAHKMYGPKGVGALYVRRENPRIKLTPMIDGGGHERGIRSGTLNVPGIVGFGKACQIVRELMPNESERLFNLRERLRNGIMSQLDDVYINGDLNQRLPNNLNLSFAFVEAESLLMSLHEEIAVSSGSACMSANIEPSYVLKAIGVKEELAHTSIRFGLGRFNTEDEIDYVIQRIVDNVKKLREISPLYEIIRQSENTKVSPSN